MKKQTIHSWCVDATRLIKFPPDRVAVQEELQQHLLDKQEELRSQGVPEEEIAAKAVEAMGSAEEIAPQLAAIHKPFWGYAYRMCCVILALVLTVSIPFLIWKLNGLPNYFRKPEFEGIFPEGTVLWRSTPDTQTSIYDYRLTLTQTCLVEDGPRGTVFMAQLKVQHPEMFIGAELMPYIWAEDSQGAVYHNYISQNYYTSDKLSRFIKVEYPQRYALGCYYTLTLWDYCSEDAQWIDLKYERDGAQFTIRIDLNRGEVG